MSNMNLLVVILKHEDLVSEICKELVEEGIHGWYRYGECCREDG